MKVAQVPARTLRPGDRVSIAGRLGTVVAVRVWTGALDRVWVLLDADGD